MALSFFCRSIVPFLKKYGINPATGEKLSAKELVRLKFHKNADGGYSRFFINCL